jgi:hypothetical protein
MTLPPTEASNWTPIWINEFYTEPEVVVKRVKDAIANIHGRRSDP